MSAPPRCPGCGTRLEPDALACPNCPLSFPERSPITRALYKRMRYAPWAGPVAFLVAMGALVWGVGAGLYSLGQGSSSLKILAFMKRHSAETGGKAMPDSPANDSEGGSVSIEPVADDRLSAPPPAPAAPDQTQPWRLGGHVYDVVTLVPLPNCTVILMDVAMNKRVQTRTNSGGHYRATLPPLKHRGYAVALSKPGYAPAYFYPGAEDVQQMSAARRQRLAKDLATRLGAPATILRPRGDGPFVADFYLARRR